MNVYDINDIVGVCEAWFYKLQLQESEDRFAKETKKEAESKQKDARWIQFGDEKKKLKARDSKAQFKAKGFEKKKEEKSKVVSINPRIPMYYLAKQLVEWGVFVKDTSAYRYLDSVLNKKVYDDDEEPGSVCKSLADQLCSFDEFLAIFLKGTLVNVIRDIASTVETFKRKNQQHLSDEDVLARSLLWKLNEYKREKLSKLLSETEKLKPTKSAFKN